MPCPTCGVCPSCGHLPTLSNPYIQGHEYINITVPVPKTSERPTIAKVVHNQFGCPTITIREESYEETATLELITLIRDLIKMYPGYSEVKPWDRIRTLVESLEE